MPEPTPSIAGVPYGLLNQKHPEYDYDRWHKLELLSEGGFRILEHAKGFLPALPNESETFLQARRKNASYINHLGPLIGYLSGSLFAAALAVAPPADDSKKDTLGQAPKVPEFWAEFSSNCDLAQTSFSQFMEQAVRDAMLHRMAVIALDMPAAPEPGVVRSRADEEILGLGRVWLDHVPLCEVYDWKFNESAEDRIPGRKKLEWIKLRRCIVDRTSPLSDASKYRERFVIWMMLPISETEWRAHFEIYETEPRAEGDPPPESDATVRKVQGPTPTSFREIPFIVLDLGKELWVGNKAGPLAIEHYRDRSTLKADMLKSLNEIPFVKKGSEIGAVHGAMPSQAQQDPNRGNNPRARYNANGWIEIGSDDELGFAGPTGRAHELCKGMLADLREEIHRTTNAMALSLANNATTVGRSGESKREDRDSTTQVLRAIGSKAHVAAIQIYTCASQARGENISWESSGLDSFDHDDRPEMVEEAPIVKDLAIPSETFAVEYTDRLVRKLLGPNTPPALLATIKKEIQKGVKEELERTEQQRELLLEGLKGGGEGEEDDGGEPPGKKPQEPGA